MANRSLMADVRCLKYGSRDEMVDKISGGG